MISITGVTNNYSMQPSLMDKHSDTLSCLSTSMHWKNELAFFQKALGEQKLSNSSVDEKKEIENFQNQITFFTLDAVEELRKRLRNHEYRLARMLEANSEWDTQYYKEHDALMKNSAELTANINTLTSTLRLWIAEHMRQSK
jgi:cell division protein FtsB